MKCKITVKKINPFMSFGKMPLANGFLKKKDFPKEFFYNLEIGFSNKLSLFQINDHPSPPQMFNKKYPFFTGSSNFMKIHFKNYSNYIKKKISNGSKLIEIGSNDGTFLSNFDKKKFDVVGVEPSKNVSEIARSNGIKSINKFFNRDIIKSIKNYKHNTDIICGANVICHIPKLKELIKTIDILLSKNGEFIFEEPYMGSMFEKTSYDQIYDEHIYMFSCTSIKKIFKLFDLNLINAIPQKTHGGSMRYVISRKKIESKNLIKILDYEKKMNLDNLQSCINFKKKCEISKKKLNEKINSIKKSGKNICGYAATSKSTTILNYCKIGPEKIDYICDTTKEKIDKFSPGKHIPIKSMSYFKKNKPDFVFLLGWNHKKEIFKKEKNFIKKKQWFAHIKI